MKLFNEDFKEDAKNILTFKKLVHPKMMLFVIAIMWIPALATSVIFNYIPLIPEIIMYLSIIPGLYLFIFFFVRPYIIWTKQAIQWIRKKFKK